ncbi:MAG: chemotaxis protein CheW [Nitrospirota bacterium]|jgi:purine-binding chemotaxis protein CheW
MSKSLQTVGFKIGKELFGVDISNVKEIVRVPEIVKVPDTPDFIEGVINLRGRIVSVIDLKKRFRLGRVDRTKASRILVAEMDGRVVGLLVDAASEVLRLPADSIEPPPDMVSGIGIDYITGVGKIGERIIILLDIKKVLNNGEWRQIAAKVNNEANKEAAALNA